MKTRRILISLLTALALVGTMSVTVLADDNDADAEEGTETTASEEAGEDEGDDDTTASAPAATVETPAYTQTVTQAPAVVQPVINNNFTVKGVSGAIEFYRGDNLVRTESTSASIMELQANSSGNIIVRITTNADNNARIAVNLGEVETLTLSGNIGTVNVRNSLPIAVSVGADARVDFLTVLDGNNVSVSGYVRMLLAEENTRITVQSGGDVYDVRLTDASTRLVVRDGGKVTNAYASNRVLSVIGYENITNLFDYTPGDRTDPNMNSTGWRRGSGVTVIY